MGFALDKRLYVLCKYTPFNFNTLNVFVGVFDIAVEKICRMPQQTMAQSRIANRFRTLQQLKTHEGRACTLY